jgi:hypothetical protein
MFYTIALICTTSRLIPAIASTNQGPEKDDLSPPWGLPAGRERERERARERKRERERERAREREIEGKRKRESEVRETGAIPVSRERPRRHARPSEFATYQTDKRLRTLMRPCSPLLSRTDALWMGRWAGDRALTTGYELSHVV